MSANGNLAVQPKECPVCQEPFNTGANLPKVFGVCGHSVCAVCVLGCIRHQPGLPPRAKCPLCRQKTPVPPNGLPTNYDLRDTLEAQLAASNLANVKCSGCAKNAPPSDVFACKACTAGERKIVLVCAVCVVKVHKAHDVVEYDAMAKAADFISVMRDERQHNDTVQWHTTELASTIAEEMKRLAKDCKVDVDTNLPMSLMTKEEHDSHAKKSSERRLSRTRTLDAAEQIIIRCRQELSTLRTDDAQTSGVRQAVASNTTGTKKRAAPSTSKKQANGFLKRIKILPGSRPGRVVIARPVFPSNPESD